MHTFTLVISASKFNILNWQKYIHCHIEEEIKNIEIKIVEVEDSFPPTNDA